MTFSVSEIPTACPVKPRERALLINAIEYSTSTDNQITQSLPATNNVYFGNHNISPSIPKPSTFRIMGFFCLTFSLVEIGIASFASQFIVGAGAYWSVIVGLIAGIASLFAFTDNGILLVSITAIIGCPIAAYGCFNDARASTTINSIVGCGEFMSGKDSGMVHHYGDSRYTELVDQCVAGLGKSIAADRSAFLYSTCMCTSSGGACSKVVLNTAALYPKDCNDVIKNLPILLILSTSFAATCAVFMIILAAAGICTTYYRKRLRESIGRVSEQGVPAVLPYSFFTTPGNSSDAASELELHEGELGFGRHLTPEGEREQGGNLEDGVYVDADIAPVEATHIPVIMCIVATQALEGYDNNNPDDGNIRSI